MNTECSRSFLHALKLAEFWAAPADQLHKVSQIMNCTLTAGHLDQLLAFSGCRAIDGLFPAMSHTVCHASASPPDNALVVIMHLL